LEKPESFIKIYDANTRFFFFCFSGNGAGTRPVKNADLYDARFPILKSVIYPAIGESMRRNGERNFPMEAESVEQNQ
jgi:hypothetical protein